MKIGIGLSAKEDLPAESHLPPAGFGMLLMNRRPDFGNAVLLLAFTRPASWG